MPDDKTQLAIERRAQEEREWAHKTFAKILFERAMIGIFTAAGLTLLAYLLKQIGII